MPFFKLNAPKQPYQVSQVWLAPADIMGVLCTLLARCNYSKNLYLVANFKWQSKVFNKQRYDKNRYDKQNSSKYALHCLSCSVKIKAIVNIQQLKYLYYNGPIQFQFLSHAKITFLHLTQVAIMDTNMYCVSTFLPPHPLVWSYQLLFYLVPWQRQCTLCQPPEGKWACIWCCIQSVCPQSY